MNSPGLHSTPILHADAKSGERINCQYTHTTGFMSACATSSLPMPRQPVPSKIDESLERTEDPLDIRQPPPHVVDYWFHQLGLSLGPTLSENPLNAKVSPFQFPLFDSIDNVSSLLSTLCHTTILRPVHPLKGFLTGFHQSAFGTANTETNSLENPLVSKIESQESCPPLHSPPNQVRCRPAQPRGVARNQPRIVRERQKSIRKVYDRPGKKPAAEYEPDPIKLEALCRLRGGMEFACQWIPRVFNSGVTLGALLRRLKLTEIESMNFQGGFAPCLAYDGFLQTTEDGFECCLCKVGKRVWWKNKKDAVRHLRKFHFGLADQCITWCVTGCTF